MSLVLKVLAIRFTKGIRSPFLTSRSIPIPFRYPLVASIFALIVVMFCSASSSADMLPANLCSACARAKVFIVSLALAIAASASLYFSGSKEYTDALTFIVPSFF